MELNRQTTSKVFMIEPICFSFNEETAISNVFQDKDLIENSQNVAKEEFDKFVALLEENGVSVVLARDTELPKTPDSIFPNNWFSTHSDGTLVLYPMCAKNRRAERKEEFFNVIYNNCKIKNVLDLTTWEEKNEFLEGTGSMVLDRENRIVYACLSPRTSKNVLDKFASRLGYDLVKFNAFDDNDVPVYHTNVIMSVAQTFVILCSDAIKDTKEKEFVIDKINKTGKKIINISINQMKNYAGNMLEICNNNSQRLLIMSDTAYNCLNNEQVSYLSDECKIIHPSLDCIEHNGGGSARCMIAELFC